MFILPPSGVQLECLWKLIILSDKIGDQQPEWDSWIDISYKIRGGY